MGKAGGLKSRLVDRKILFTVAISPNDLILDKIVYSFNKLEKNELPTGVDREATFFAMYDFMGDSAQSIYFDSFKDMSPLLNRGVYYVAHNVITRKGKTLIFRGKLVTAEQSNLISYLKNAISENDLRPLLIAPVFDTSPDQVIYLSDDGCHVYSATH